MINPLVQVRQLGLALEAATLRRPQLLTRLAAALVALLAMGYGALLGGGGAPLLYLLVAPLGVIGLWLTFTLPEYAALILLGFRWGFIFDSLDSSLGLQSPSLPLAALLLIVLATQVLGPQRRRLSFDPILLLLICYLGHVAFGIWYATYPELVNARVVDFSKDIVYTFVVAFWLVRPRLFEGAIWLLVAIGAVLGTLTVYQELTQTYDNNYFNLAKVKIAFIVEGVADAPRAAGSVGDPNFYGQQLVVLLPLALWWAIHARSTLARIMAIYASFAILAGIGLTYSRGALLAVPVMALVYMLRFKVRLRYLLYVLPLILAAALLAPPELTARFGTLTEIFSSSDIESLQDNSLENRTRHIVIGFNMFLDNPIIGMSADHFKAFYIDYAIQLGLTPDSDQNRNAHNYYLEVLVEHGLVGLGLVLTMMALTFRRFSTAQRIYSSLGNQRMADLGGFLQVGFVGYALTAFFLHGDFPRFLWLLLGMAIAFHAGAREELAARADAPALVPPTTVPRLGAAEL